MQGNPPTLDRIPNLSNWDLGPFNRWSFQHVREIMPTVEVRRSDGHAARFETDLQDLEGLAVTAQGGEASTLGQVLLDSYTDGFLLLHRGRIVFERYFNQMSEEAFCRAMWKSRKLIGNTTNILRLD